MSVSAVQWSESAICMHISPLFWISFPFRSPQSTEFPVLYSRFSLVIHFIHSSVYMSIPISQFIPPHLCPLGVHTFVLYVCVSIRVWLSKSPSVEMNKRHSSAFPSLQRFGPGPWRPRRLRKTKTFCLMLNSHPVPLPVKSSAVLHSGASQGVSHIPLTGKDSREHPGHPPAY